jgi:phytoene dehydrogenase-like protein
MSEKIRFLIIGAGISGLHIGALLSRYGNVKILEKSHKIGGRAKLREFLLISDCQGKFLRLME